LERAFVYVCLVGFLQSLSWATINIILALYADTFGVPALLGTLWSVIGLSRFLSENPGGILVDRVGRKPVIAGGIIVILSSYVRYFSAQTATDMILSGALAGTGFAVSHIGLMAQAADLAPPEERTRYMGIFQGSMMSSQVIGPIVGSLVADYYGLRAPFIASILFITVATFLAFTRIGELKAVDPVEEKGGILKDYSMFLKNKLFLALFLVSFLFSLIGWCFRSIVFPIYGKKVLSLTVAQIGLLSSIESIVLFVEQFFLADIMERRLSRRLTVTSGFIIYGAAIYSITSTSDFYTLAAISAILGMGIGTITPSLEATWVDITRVEERGRVYGVRIAFFDLGQISWSMIITSLMSVDPRLPFYAIVSATLLSASLLSLILRPRKQVR